MGTNTRLAFIGTMAFGSLLSGTLLTSFGWTVVNIVAFPPILLALVVLIWLERRHRAATPDAS